jgi:hypothetical protein
LTVIHKGHVVFGQLVEVMGVALFDVLEMRLGRVQHLVLEESRRKVEVY